MMGEDMQIDLSTVASTQQQLNDALYREVVRLSPHDLRGLSIEAIASEAYVSRATAYRFFKNRRTLFFCAAVELGRRHFVLGRRPGLEFRSVAAQVEDAFALTVDQTFAERVLLLLELGDRPHALTALMEILSLDEMTPLFEQGQLSKEVRADLSVSEILAWLDEQRRLVVERGLGESETRRWVRKFVAPALRPPPAGNVRPSPMESIQPILAGHLRAMHLEIERLQALL